MSHFHVLLHSNIKHVDLSACSSLISDQIISAVVFRCKKITQLFLKNCSRLSTKALKKIPSGLTRLQSIDLSGCLACTDEVLNLLGTSCPELTVLRVESCTLLTDAGLAGLCEDVKNPKCRRLKEVNLSSTGVTSYGIQKLLNSQQEIQKMSLAMTNSVEEFDISVPSIKLSSLDLSYTFITDTCMKILCKSCPLLCDLSLNCCTSLTVISLEFIASLAHLKVLRIGDNKAMKFHPHLAQFLVKSGNSLKVLDISGMDRVDTEILGVCCKSLETLNMADCTKVTGSYIHVSTADESKWVTLAQACPKLSILNLHNCHFLHHKSLAEHLLAILSNSTELQELDLSGIEKLSDEIILQLIQSSGLLLLRSVNLSMCSEISVESVELLIKTCKGLSQLNLSHCRNISLCDAENLKKVARDSKSTPKIAWI